MLALGVAPHAAAAPPADDAAPGAPPAHLSLDVPATLAIAGGSLAVWGASAIASASSDATHCRWCSPGSVDRWARTELRWADTAAAATASDVLVVAIPVGCATALAWSAATAGTSRREIAEDLVAFGEAVLATQALTAAAKTAALRLRPDAWATGRPTTSTDVHSFFSGHTSATFSAAAAATQIARLRGRPAWPWVAVVGFGGAAVTGWLRMASDEHWLSDVLAGAAVGTGVGLTVPLLVLRPAPARPGFTLAPAPGGLTVAGVF